MIARFASTCTFSALALAAVPAHATPAEPPPAAVPPADDGAQAQPADGAIVVTARRRTETLQTVPIAVSVIGGERLSDTGSFNVARLASTQPSVQFYSSNPRNSAANIRGLGAPFGLTNDGIEQGVGVYVDQVYYSRIAAGTFDFIDIDRVEILRGPQGTLYGKNTTAGAINLTSRAPRFTPEGQAELSFGNLGFVQAKASLSGPIVDDRLAIRLGISSTSRRGTITNVTTRLRDNSQDNIGLRAALLWRPTDALNITLSGDFSRQNPICCAQIYTRVGTTQRPLNRQFASLAAAFHYAPPSLDPFDRLTDLDTDLRARQDYGGASLRAEWNVGSGTITSVTAWRFWKWDPSNDRDFTGLPITTVSANPSRQQQWTQELRYASSGTHRIDYVVGLFAFTQKLHTFGAQVQGAAASRWLLGPSGTDPAVLNGLRSDNDIHFSNTSLAAFGQLTWRLSDRLRIQPGLRVNEDRKDGSYVATVTNGTGTALTAAQLGVLAPQSYRPHFSASNLSGDLTLSWDLWPAVMAYATTARAFKSGGINLSGLPLDAANKPILASATVKPEKETHYELGLKSQWFDRRATLNLAAFWSDIADYQATVTNSQYAVLRGYLANAPKVRVRGIEADLSARPAARLSLYANGAFTDARYVKFPDAPCPPELSGGTTASAANPASPAGTAGGFSPAACDISGQWLPGISRWSASYGGEYAVPARLFGHMGQVYLGFDGSSRSKFSSNPSRSIYTDVAGSSLANVRVGFRTDHGWDAMLWLRNAFDTHYFELLATQSGNTGLVVGQPGDPHTYGVTLRARF